MYLPQFSLDLGGPNLCLKQSDSQELLSEEILCGRETSGNHLHSKSHKTDFLVRKKGVFLEAVRNLERDNCDTHLLKHGILFNLANC